MADSVVVAARSSFRARLVNIGCTSVVAGVHLLCLGAPFVHFSWRIVAFTAVSYVLQVLGITAGYHRYFSHHAFKTSRVFQFVLGYLGCSAMQNGPLWWASGHRRHHRYSDKPGDPHSPVLRGFRYAHIGWVLDGTNDHPDLANVKDFTRYPELRFLDAYKWLPTIANGIACTLLLGLPGLFWVFGIGTTLAFHAPLFVNSLGHLRGRQRFDTNDGSRNNLLLGILVLGEGWHNNHHHAQRLARHGLLWWEVDVTYYAIRMLQAVGVVWGVCEQRASAHPRRTAAATAVSATLCSSFGDFRLQLKTWPCAGEEVKLTCDELLLCACDAGASSA